MRSHLSIVNQRKWNLFSTCFLLLMPFILPAQKGNSVQVSYDTAFIHTYGGFNFDEAREIRETPDGGFILIGTTSSFGQGSTSFYAVKTDYMANPVWTNNYGGLYNDVGNSVENTHDGGFLFIGFTNTFGGNGYEGYVVKTDGSGTQQWQKTYGDYDWDFLYHSCAMPDSGFILCGETYSNSVGNADAWLIRINKNGDTLWTKKYGSYENEVYNAVLHYNNKIYAAGKEYNLNTGKFNAIIKRYDINGNITGSYVYATDTLEDFEYKNILLTAAGKLVLVGVKSFKPDSMASITMEVDTAFTYIWQDYGGYQSYKSTVCAIENSKNYIITSGNANGGLGGTAFLMTSFNQNGGYLDGCTFGGTNDETNYSAVITQDKRMAFIGSTKSIGAGDKDMYLILMKKDTLIHDHKQVFSSYYDTLSLTVVDIKEEALEKSISIYPNPLTEKCTIVLSGTEKNEVLNVLVYDMFGHPILNKTAVSGQSFIFERNNLAPGAYIIQVISKNRSFRKKLIID
jgi:hypothetical protein